MGEKFLGVGMKNAIGLTLFGMLFLLMARVIFTKYQVSGPMELFNA